MKFIDEASISVQAGKGGAGSTHFRREKFVPFGGPDGGDGGRGGSVILRADRNKHTLLDLKLTPKLVAENGGPGGKQLKNGRCGEHLTINVPVGTQVYTSDDPDTPVADLTGNGDTATLARGGRGGKGNAFFKSATNQAPRKCQPGEAGEQNDFIISLKILADIGIVGLPNAGKSTFIARVSSATPKIADYPFTTLSPNRGVVHMNRFQSGNTDSFIMADVPGLIEGAHTGRGLGIRFLKHLERTSGLLHLIDCSTFEDIPAEALDAYETINGELIAFSDSLSNTPCVVGLSKVDCLPDREDVKEAVKLFEARGITALPVSSASGEGIEGVIESLYKVVIAARSALSEEVA